MKNNRSNPAAGITRREFIGTAAAATAFTIVPRHVLGQTAPSKLVNIAVVGSGGHGAFVVTQMLKAGGINVVALCDVDAEFARHIETMEYGSRHITGLYRQFPNVPKYKDFRVMLVQEQKNSEKTTQQEPKCLSATRAPCVRPWRWATSPIALARNSSGIQCI